MDIGNWIKGFFGINQTTVNLTQTAITTEQQLDIELFAIHSAISLVSNAISQCEFKTYLKGVEVKQDEYYLWNIEPNKNENSSQFKQEFISKLLFNNEALMIPIGNQLIIADSFYQEEFAINENIFSSIVKGTMSFNKTFNMSEVMYFKLGNTDIRKLLSRLMIGYNNLVNMSMNKYNKSGGRKGILDIDSTASGNKNFQQKFDDLMNVRFKKYFDAENAVLPLEKGYKYEEQAGESGKKSISEITDLSILTKEILSRVAQAFKIPVSLLLGDIADVSNLTDNFLTFCIDPICCGANEEIARKRYGKSAYIAKNYLKIDTTCIKHLDLFSISQAFDKLIASGGYSIDELRLKLGDVELNTDYSKKHWITKNYQDIETPPITTTTTTIS